MPVSAADTRRALSLAALLAGAGATHFAVPKFYDAMIPEPLPGTPRMWTYGSAMVEIATAAAVAAPPTRRTGGLAAAGTVRRSAAGEHQDGGRRPQERFAGLPPRHDPATAIQAPLIAWALKVRRSARS